jgi:hypothetical protein
MNVGCAAGGWPQRREDKQRDKQEEKEDLRDPAQQGQSGSGHETPSRNVCAQNRLEGAGGLR